jgi:hypothetical protein
VPYPEWGSKILVGHVFSPGRDEARPQKAH